jgi:hypothetical protein
MTEVPLAEPADRQSTGDRSQPSHRPTIARMALLVGLLAFAAFWGWALFFASKVPANRIDDRAWGQRAEVICAEANEQRIALADFREMAEATPELVRERADIVDAATDIIEQMLDDVVARPPADAKGLDLVPQWEADYRAYIGDRRTFTESLRETGENLAFYETEASGIPISEKLETFAADNRMSSCAPPRDLTR